MRRHDHSGVNVNAKRRATLSDVARRARVSPVTVSRAIRHPETAVAQTTAELTELVDTALTTDRLAPLPLPQTELPVDTALAVDVDQLERTDTPLPPPV